MVAVALPSWWAWAFAFVWLAAMGTLVWRDVARAAGRDAVKVTRSLPAKMSIGVSNEVDLEIRNSGARPARLTAFETPPPAFDGDRELGSYELPPFSSHTVTVGFTPLERGAHRFGQVALRSVGPWGFGGWDLRAASEETVKVYPDVTAVHTYQLLARKGALVELGVRPLRFSGAGTEFEALREYQPGDTYRDVDWKATARRFFPVVRTFEVERSQAVVLAVDAGRLMTPVVAGLSKLDRAINAALLLSFLATEGDDQVGLLVFGRDVQTFLPPQKGRRQFQAILEALYAVEGRVEEPDYAGALRFLASRLSKRSLVVLFTDLAGTEPSRRLLTMLGALTPRHLPLVITQRNRFTEALASREPGAELDVFESAVAEGLLRDKAEALRVLVANGSLVLDVQPEELSVAAVNRYLTVKTRGEL
jgi:uncharacterized protein (DUF58 family)